MHRPKVVKDLLILQASFFLYSFACDFFILSDPPRSAKINLDLYTFLVSVNFCVKFTVIMQWERLDLSFISVFWATLVASTKRENFATSAVKNI